MTQSGAHWFIGAMGTEFRRPRWVIPLVPHVLVS
jgi:hypothetical protein